jgi:hypothetical protein
MVSIRLAGQVFVFALIGSQTACLAQDCLAAATQAEQQFRLPPGLLGAIGRVESGRRDPLSGHVAPWPWTIDVDGAGAFLPSQDSAVSSVRLLLGQGGHSIDVGCFQINLQYHPTAFASLEEALDPAANARYAARFLAVLYSRFGNWPTAIMNYHSATTERGAAYRDRVLANWSGADTPLPTYGITIWTPGSAAPSVLHFGPATVHLPHIIVPTQAG